MWVRMTITLDNGNFRTHGGYVFVGSSDSTLTLHMPIVSC
jgi:hypothetical protein